jgi:hypothetical protein
MGSRHPRNALLVGLMFVGIAVVYWLVSHDAGGTTTLAMLGIAMGLAAYALVVGSPDDV